MGGRLGFDSPLLTEQRPNRAPLTEHGAPSLPRVELVQRRGWERGHWPVEDAAREREWRSSPRRSAPGYSLTGSRRSRDALRAGGGIARSALHRNRPSSDFPSHLDQHVLGRVAAGRSERVQRRTRQTLLRQPAPRDLRGSSHRRRRPVHALLEDRAADVEADPRRRLCLRSARVVEGLPLAAPRP